MIRPLAAAGLLLRFKGALLKKNADASPLAEAPSSSPSGKESQSEGKSPDTPEAEVGGDPVSHTLKIPIDGVLDLHTFRPKEVPSLLDEWLRECSGRGICSVRIIHGKGTGVLKARVESILKKHPLVTSYRTAGEDAGGWGAALAELCRSPSEKTDVSDDMRCAGGEDHRHESKFNSKA